MGCTRYWANCYRWWGAEDAKMKIHIQSAQVASVLQGTNEIRSWVEVSPLSYVLASPP